MQPFVAPEIADTPLDASSKPRLTTAVDIWSLGIMTFILRTNCLPMNRDNKEAKFDAESIVNSPQYRKLFSEE